MSKSGDKTLSWSFSLNKSENVLGQKVDGMHCAVVLSSSSHSQYLQPTKKMSLGQVKSLLKSCLVVMTVGGLAVRTCDQIDSKFTRSSLFCDAVITPKVKHSKSGLNDSIDNSYLIGRPGKQSILTSSYCLIASDA